MKKMGKLVSILIVALLMITPISAHPGRTDANGGHYCRTNCAKWGLKDGEYHYHNGGGSSSSKSETSTQEASSSTTSSDNTAITNSTPKIDYTKQGDSEGYNFKKAHPDENKQDISGKDQTYIDGYNSGFERAESELTESSKKQGEIKGDEDGDTTEVYNLEVPVGLISAVYLSSYKEAYNQRESSDFSKIKQVAKEEAIDDVLNLQEKNLDNEYSLDKQKKVYEDTYQNTYEQEETEIKDLKKKISSYAKNDFEDEKPNDKKYRKYKNYKVYDVLDKKYKKEYNKLKEQKEQEDTNVVAGGGGIIALGIIGYVVYKRKRK